MLTKLTVSPHDFEKGTQKYFLELPLDTIERLYYNDVTYLQLVCGDKVSRTYRITSLKQLSSVVNFTPLPILHVIDDYLMEKIIEDQMALRFTNSDLVMYDLVYLKTLNKTYRVQTIAATTVLLGEL